MQSAAAASAATGPVAIALSLALDALVAPTLYLHLRAVAEPERRPSPVHALLPAATILAASALAVVGEPADPPSLVQALTALAVLATATAVTIGQGAYLVLGWRRVAAVERFRPGALRWTRRLLGVSAAIFVLGLVATAAGIAGLLPDEAARAVELPTTVALFALALGAVADLGVFGAVAAAVVVPGAKYARSALRRRRPTRSSCGPGVRWSATACSAIRCCRCRASPRRSGRSPAICRRP